MAQPNREVHDLNVHGDYCRNRSPVDAIYEMLANGSTADSTSFPEITHDIGTKKVSIKDYGPGILKKHFVMGRSRGKGHSNHGIGLKDAIVVLRREYQATITIRTREFLYTFTDAKGSLGDETLHLVVDKVDLGGSVDSEILQGTQIDIEYNAPGPDAVSKDVARVKESFLELFKANLILLAAEEHLEMYIPREGAGTEGLFDYVFVLGIKIRTPDCEFRCVYNIKGCLVAMVKSMVNRDHHISKKFKKEIFPHIQDFAYETVVSKPRYFYLMYPDYPDETVVTSATCEFRRPSMPTPPPQRDVTASPVSTISSDSYVDAQQPIAALPSMTQFVPRPAEEIEFHRSLAMVVFTFLDEQNSPMINLSPRERKRVRTDSDAVKEALRRICGLSIARIGNSGSIAKNTAVLYSVDVDMVVFFNHFQPTRVADYARIIKRELAYRGCRFLSSADDILECVYGSVNIDIVLTSADDIDHPRYREFQSGPEAVTYFKESIRGNAWVAEVVRAAKYWVMRCNDDDGHRVKSLAVELVVLEVYKACEEQCASRTTKDNREALFLGFLQFLTRPSVEQRIPHQPEKEDVFEEIMKPLKQYKRLAEAALQVLQ